MLLLVRWGVDKMAVLDCQKADSILFLIFDF